MTLTDETRPDTVDDAADDAENAGTVESAVPDAESDGKTGPGWRSRLRRNLTLLVAAVVMVAAVATAVTMYFTVHQDDQATDAAARKDVVAAANAGTTALLSYAPKTLDADLAKGRTHLTGQFLTYYREFTDKVVKPAAQDSQITTRAVVSRAAVEKMSPDEATVLVFVNKSTTSKDKPEAELTSSSVRVGLQRAGGRWLISAFDPV